MRPLLAVAVVSLVVAVGCKSGSKSDEVAFVESELAELRTALQAADDAKILVGCTSVTSSLPRMPASVAEQIERLCGVEAPRVHLRNAIADTRAQQAAHPELQELACTQLFVESAFEAVAQFRSRDAELAKLVDEYTSLCPAEVAKLRARSRPGPS